MGKNEGKLTILNEIKYRNPSQNEEFSINDSFDWVICIKNYTRVFNKELLKK